ncbi:MAG: phosphotyrosine protein phosphatase [Verrucomicrobiota bacterium]
MKLLFLCSRNQWRSPTAEAIYQNDPRVQVRSAGVSSAARIRVTEKLLRWADVVCVMEHTHKKRLHADFPEVAADLNLEVLDIPDDYPYMDSDLVELLRERVEPLIQQGGEFAD